MSEQQKLQLIATQDVEALIQTAPAVLDRNKEAIEKINARAQILLDAKTEKGMNAELDKLMNDFLVKVRDAKVASETRRKPLTQLFDQVKASFTNIEKMMDPKSPGTLVAAIQDARNEWARTLAEIERKREQEALLKKNQAAEITGLKFKMENRFRDHFKILLNTQLTDMQNAFNGLTLENKDKVKSMIAAWPEEYPHGHFSGFAPDFSREIIYNDKSIEAGILQEVKESGMYDVLYNEFLNAIQDKKQTLIDMYPGKIASLQKEEEAKQEAARAEAARKEAEAEAAKQRQIALEAENAAAAEEARQRAAIAEREAALAEERRKEQEAAQAKEAAEAAARQKEMEAEQARETAARDEKARIEAENRKAEQEAMNLFSHTAENTAAVLDQPSGQVRGGYEIIVKAQAGWMLILNLWFQHDGATMAIDKFEKKTLGSIKGWCEKHAHKTGEKISSPLIEYKEIYTAVSTK